MFTARLGTCRVQVPGVTLTTFLDQTPDLDLSTRSPIGAVDGTAPIPDDIAPTADEVASVVEHDPTLVPETVTKTAAREDDTAEPEHDDLLDIEDSTRLYLREIARVPLLTAEEEVMLAKTMELGLRITRDPALAVLDLHVWTANNTEPTARTKHSRHALPYAEISARVARAAITSDDA